MDNKTENPFNEAHFGDLPKEKLTIGKLIFLVVLTGLLCTMGPLSIFAPVPLTMGILLYGRARTAMTVGVAFLFLVFLQSMVQMPGAMLVVFVMAYIYSLLLGEIIFREVRPSKGLMMAGAIVIALIGLALLAFDLGSEMGLKEIVGQYVAKFLANLKESSGERLRTGGEEARMIRELLDHPEDIVKNIIQWSPTAIVISTFLGLWASLFMVLRNGLIWKQKLNYRYGIRDLVEFKTPEWFVYPLILSLALFVGGEKLMMGESAEIIGGNMLYILGVFYFFQGFGIFSDFLTYLGIFGIFRSVLMIFTIFSAWRILAVVGMFDLWLNFRKYLKRNKDNEGDKL